MSIRKHILFYTLLVLSIQNMFAQFDTAFFPPFQPYVGNPIIKYGDGFVGAAWNDPVVLKENGMYTMYASASEGITTIKVKIYRLISFDGYSWTLSPSTPVIEPDSGTYYAGGTETPSVVFHNNLYHIYLTVYPSNNISTDFTIAHGTSLDGINWTMDAQPIFESNGQTTWHGDVVGEPGALIFNDSIYLFFTAAGIQNGNFVQSIGLIKSDSGFTFSSPTQQVLIPNDVYPSTANWFGLSTPSVLAINDTIYLFTDVAQIRNGVWTQVALHHFKTIANSGTWYHSDSSIHKMEDFSWTNGSFLSELRSITPLLDDSNRLRIWYAGNRIADIDVFGDTIFHFIIDSNNVVHVDPNFWGIGTSEFQFPLTTSIKDFPSSSNTYKIYPNPASDFLILEGLENNDWVILNNLGQEIIKGNNSKTINIKNLPNGIYFFKSTTDNYLHKIIINH